MSMKLVLKAILAINPLQIPIIVLGLDKLTHNLPKANQ